MYTRHTKDGSRNSKHLLHEFEGISTDIPGNTSRTEWMARCDDFPVNFNFVYHGLVENIRNRRAATVVIGQTKEGMPLTWHEKWGQFENNKYARVLLLVDHLRPTLNDLEYKKDEDIREKVIEGEVIMVSVHYSRNYDSTLKYFASSAYKLKDLGPIMNSSFMLNLQDPLRGFMHCILANNAGVIRFRAYNGRVSEAVCTSNSFYKSGKRMKGNVSIESIAPVGSLVFLEAQKWTPKETGKEWENISFENGIRLQASIVWLKDDVNPTLKNDDSLTLLSDNTFDGKMKDLRGNITDDNKLLSDYSAGERKLPKYSLKSSNAYYGVVETLSGKYGAIICTAHCSGEPLTWEDDWISHGIILERVLVLSHNIRQSKNSPEFAKGTSIENILRTGDKVMLVVQPTSKKPEECYKWFAKTSWKVGHEMSVTSYQMSVLSGHLSGTIDSFITHDMGIISFRTYHGHLVKAFFRHDNMYINGKKLLASIPLAAKLKNGTKVHLVPHKWRSGENQNKNDLILHHNKVTYKAVQVWKFGTPSPSVKEYMDNLINSGSINDLSGLCNPSKHYDTDTKGCPTKNLQRVGAKSRHRRKRFQHSRRTLTRRNLSCPSLEDLPDAMSLSMENLKIEEGCQSSSEDSSASCDDRKSEGKPKNEDVFERPKMETCSPYVPEDKSSLAVTTNNSNCSDYGSLVSVEETWGLIHVQDHHEVYDFHSDSVFFFGLKLEGIPLQRLFHQGQPFRVHLENGKVIAMEYGSLQHPHLIRKAILAYCEKSSVSNSIRELLESLMKKYGV